MAFTPKDWKDAPDHSTPLSAAALEDLETRVTGYADAGDALLVPKSLVDAKGDLLVATADNTVARKAVGADDQVLTADSTDPSGVAWKPPSGGSDRAITEIGGVDIPWSGGVSDGNGAGDSFVVKQAGVAALVGEAGFTPSSSAQELFTLPVGLRPLAPGFSDFVAIVEWGICWVDPPVPCRITVAANGVVTVADLPVATVGVQTFLEFTGINFPTDTV